MTKIIIIAASVYYYDADGVKTLAENGAALTVGEGQDISRGQAEKLVKLGVAVDADVAAKAEAPADGKAQAKQPAPVADSKPADAAK